MTGGQCAFGTQCFTLESEGSLDYQPATAPRICVYQYQPLAHVAPFYCYPRLHSVRCYFLILSFSLLFGGFPKKVSLCYRRGGSNDPRLIRWTVDESYALETMKTNVSIVASLPSNLILATLTRTCSERCRI